MLYVWCVSSYDGRPRRLSDVTSSPHVSVAPVDIATARCGQRRHLPLSRLHSSVHTLADFSSLFVLTLGSYCGPFFVCLECLKKTAGL